MAGQEITIKRDISRVLFPNLVQRWLYIFGTCDLLFHTSL